MQLTRLGKPFSKRWKVSSLLLSFLSGAALIAIAPFGQRLIAGSQLYSYPFSSALTATNQQTVERSISFYQGRVQQSPTDGLNRAALAAAYLKMGRVTGGGDWYALAEKEAKQSLANLPFENDGAVMVLAEIAQAEHDFAKALRLVEPLSGPKPLTVVVTSKLAMGQVAEAATAADVLVDFVPSLGSLSLRGLVWQAQGKLEEAMSDFQQAITAEEPSEQRGSAQVRTFLGELHAVQGENEQARQLYRAALEIVPNYPLALMHIAELETQQGNYQAATKYYSQLSEMASLEDVGLQGIARIKTLQGKDAQTEWQGAETYLRSQMDDSALSHRRDLAYLLLERGHDRDVPEALALMQTEAQNRRDAKTLSTLAWAFSRAGRWQEAQTVIREALDQGTQDAGIFYRAADIEAALNQLAQAEEYTRLAQALNPTFSRP